MAKASRRNATTAAGGTDPVGETTARRARTGVGAGSGARPAASQPAAVPAGRRERRADLVDRRREERIHLAERQRRQRMIRRWAYVALATIAVLGLVFVGYNRYQVWQGDQQLEDTVSFTYAGQQHQDGPVTYTETPPVGGVHNNAWQNCGYYDRPVANWHAVHSLEHGAVWITYLPTLPADQIAELRSLAEEQSYILVSPYPDQRAPVIASAWNRQLTLDGADDPGLDAFVREYRRSADAPEPRGICTNGITVATG